MLFRSQESETSTPTRLMMEGRGLAQYSILTVGSIYIPIKGYISRTGKGFEKIDDHNMIMTNNMKKILTLATVFMVVSLALAWQ